MKIAFRAVAVSVVLALALGGPLAPFATAQQPLPPVAPPPAVAPAPPAAPVRPAQPGAPPQMFQEEVKPMAAEERGTDIFDVAAGTATVLGFPLKAAICGLGLAFGFITLAGTFGSRPDASSAIISEGCGGKAPWVVRGSDLRPKGGYKAAEWQGYRPEWER
jgi:hypothetical protein